MISGKNKMADLVHINYLLISVISRFGIQLGFGNKSVEEVCADHTINLEFFLEIVNSFHDKDYFPHKHLQDFSIQLITDYLGKTHTYYLNEKIPEIEHLINKMVEECYNKSENAPLLKSFFQEYKNELFQHIQREDEKVFPYAMYVENKFLGRTPETRPRGVSKNYSIQEYNKEHDNIEEKLFDLKNIIIKYLPAPGNPSLCNQVISELFILEKDINDHSRIEDKVLIPKVELMEQAIRSSKPSHT